MNLPRRLNEEKQMATYRVKLSREVAFTETAEIEIELPAVPHPTDDAVREEIGAGYDMPWREGEYNFGGATIESVEGLVDDEDVKEEKMIFPI